MKRKALFVLGGIAAMFSAQFAHAQALADKVPGDAVVYLGWAGADAAKARYGDTHLKAVLDESRINEVFGKYLDQLEAMIVKRERKAAEPFRLLRKLGAPVWKYPTAFYLGKPDLSNVDSPRFTLAMLSQVGTDAESIATDIQKLLPPHKSGEPTVAAVAKDGIVYFTVSSEPDAALNLSAGTLASAKPFADSLKQVQKDPLMTRYIDFETIVGLVESGVAQKDEEASGKIKSFLDSSGLRGLKRLIGTCAFEGKDWVSECFIATEGTKTGLLKACPSGPIDPALFSGIPADATLVKTVRFDPAVVTAELRNTLEKTDANAHKFYNMGFGTLQQVLGTNVEQSILEPLGSDWVVYGAPAIGSGGILGLVAVNKLDDAVALKKGLGSASVNLVNWINVGIAQSEMKGKITVRGGRTKIGTADIFYLAAPIIAPSWAIDDGKLYLGLYPQTVGAAIRQAHSGKPTIGTSEKYVAALKTLKHDNLEGIGYFDLPTAAGHGSMYPTLLMIGRYIGVADLFGPTLPEPLLPPNDILIENLAPAAEGSWTDSAGTHFKSVTSFPGAMLLSEQTAALSAGVGAPALMTSILLPSLNRARETANRVKSASNLKQIGMGILLYSNENRNKYPPDLAELIKTQDLVVEVFDNPRTDRDLEPTQDDLSDPAKIGAYVNENSEYVYVGAGMTNAVPAETVVAYENPEGLEDGINILFGDGHVEFVMMDQAMTMIPGQPNNP